MRARLGSAAVLAAAPALAQPAIPAPPGDRETPLAIARAAVMSDGAVRVISDWIPYAAPAADSPRVPYFDAFEPGSDGTPTGFCTSGCTQGGWCPSTPESWRWWLGTSWRNPFAINDMTVTTGAAGLRATEVRFAWMWGETAPTRCLVGVFTAEGYSDCTIGPPAWSGVLDGVVMDFGLIGGGAGSFHWSTADVETYGLGWTMPSSGSGAYSVLLANAQDAGGALVADAAWGTQPMLWGCGDAESPPDGRPGHQGPTQWDDWRNANGVIEANECSYYFDIDKCPRPYGAMLAFAGPPTCWINCDASTTAPIVNTADFTCFLQQYAVGIALPGAQQQWHYSNCDRSTTYPQVNTGDFTCFLQKYAAGCS